MKWGDLLGNILDEWQDFLQVYNDSDDSCDSECDTCEFREECLAMSQPDEDGNVNITPDMETYLSRHFELFPYPDEDG